MALRERVEISGHDHKLRGGRRGRAHRAAKALPPKERLRVPAEVLARSSHADVLAIERVMIREMPGDEVADFDDGRRRQVRARREEVRDLAKDPRPSLCR